MSQVLWPLLREKMMILGEVVEGNAAVADTATAKQSAGPAVGAAADAVAKKDGATVTLQDSDEALLSIVADELQQAKAVAEEDDDEKEDEEEKEKEGEKGAASPRADDEADAPVPDQLAALYLALVSTGDDQTVAFLLCARGTQILEWSSFNTDTTRISTPCKNSTCISTQLVSDALAYFISYRTQSM